MKNAVKKSLIAGFLLLLIIIGVRYFNIGSYLTFEQLKNNAIYLKQAVENNYWLSVSLYLIVYIATIACCIPGTPPLTILGGFLFNIFPGILYAMIGTIVGATISFLVIRYVLKNTIHIYFLNQINQFNKQIATYGMINYLLILQLATIFPFFVINVMASFAKVPLWIFILTSLIGSLPSLLIYTIAGRQLGTIESVGDIFSPSTTIIFLILALFILLPLILKRFHYK